MSALSMFLAAVIFILCTVTSCVDMSCYSCGGECAPACHTKNFRACCHNFYKRGDPSIEVMPQELSFQIPMVEQKPAQNYPSALRNFILNSTGLSRRIKMRQDDPLPPLPASEELNYIK